MQRVNVIPYAILVLFGIFLFLNNWFFVPQSDDVGVLAGGLDAMIGSYIMVNGRFFEALRFGYIGAFTSTICFALLNACIGVIFLFVSFVLFFGRVPKNFHDGIILILLIFCLITFSIFGSIFIWPAGALNYLWSYTLIFLVLLPYRFFYKHVMQNHGVLPKPTQNNILRTLYNVSFFIVNFCAGMCTEILGILVLLCHAMLLCYACVIKRLKIPAWYYIGVLGFFIGYCCLYFSPGNARRIAYIGEGYLSLRDVFAMGFYDIILRLNDIYKHLIRSFVLCVFVFAVFLFIYERYKSKALFSCFIILACFGLAFLFSFFVLSDIYYFLRSCLHIVFFFTLFIFYKFIKKGEWDTAIFARLYFQLFVVFSVLLMTISVTLQIIVPGRAQLFVILITFIGVIALYQALVAISFEYLSKLQYYISVACLAYALFIIGTYVHVHYKWQGVLEDIETQKEKGAAEIVLKREDFESFYKRYGDFILPNNDCDTWPNPTYAGYFSVARFCVQD